ncbi:nose resistant to fluoxetine protein 6-like isoform 1-T2 [Cochliomyia hominivorax]
MLISNIIHIFKIILALIALCQGHLHDDMPALYNFDHYKECINRNESTQSFPAKYSMVLVEIQPNNESLIWEQMIDKRRSKFNYRHEYIFRGVCLERCKRFIKSVESDDNTDNGLLINEQTEVFQTIYNTSIDRLMRYKFHRIIYECINEEYLENYNFSTKTSVIYAIDPQHRTPKDIYFYFTILLVIVILLITTLSSFYDGILKSVKLIPEDVEKYYDVNHENKVNRFLTAFSLYRNYKRLILPNRSDIGNDLAFLDGLRSVICLLILLEHTCIVQYIHLENTEFVENFYEHLLTRMLLACLIWLEIFFILSGLLLYVKFEKGQYITNKSSFMDCVSVFVRLMLSRYLRYLPSLVFIIVINANLSYYHENGSFTRFIMASNCLPCRQHWWYNIFMIVNYKIKNSCLMHTWYIAADFHLYGIFLFILILITKYQNTKTWIFSGVAILAAVINFGINYWFKFELISMVFPESYRYFYFKDLESPKYLYFSTYTNINSFQLGIICGLIYMRYLRGNEENKKRLSKILKYAPYLGWPFIIGILYLGAINMEHTETTIWTSAYGLLQRHVGLAIVAIIVILRGFCFGGGIFKSTIFRFLSRISYQIYLWQIVFLTNLVAVFNEPVHLNFYNLLLFHITTFISIILISVMVALLVEYPCAEIIAAIDIEKKLKPVKMTKIG